MLAWNGEAFVAALQGRDDVRPSPEFVAAVGRAVQAAAARWDSIPVPPDLEVFLAERIPPQVRPTSRSVPFLVPDLYLACACLSGQHEAIAELRERLATAAAPAFRHIQLDPATADDVLQQVMERLIVPEAGAKLAAYSGRGPLRAWLRSTALRQALKAIRRRAPRGDVAQVDHRLDNHTDAQTDTQLAAMLVADPVEGEFLRAHYGDKFREALQLAFAELSARERGLLRQHYLDGLTLAQLARLHDVDRSTVARWLGAARARLVAQTRRVAHRKHGVPRAEFDSLLRRVWSQLRPDLRELLQSQPHDVDP